MSGTNGAGGIKEPPKKTGYDFEDSIVQACVLTPEEFKCYHACMKGEGPKDYKSSADYYVDDANCNWQCVPEKDTDCKPIPPDPQSHLLTRPLSSFVAQLISSTPTEAS